jgi:hypothetical protein
MELVKSVNIAGISLSQTPATCCLSQWILRLSYPMISSRDEHLLSMLATGASRAPNSLAVLFRRVHGRYSQYLNAWRRRRGGSVELSERDGAVCRPGRIREGVTSGCSLRQNLAEFATPSRKQGKQQIRASLWRILGLPRHLFR